MCQSWQREDCGCKGNGNLRAVKKNHAHTTAFKRVSLILQREIKHHFKF